MTVRSVLAPSGGLGMAAQAAAQVLAQQDPAGSYMTPGRLWSAVAAVLGLAGIVAGGLALARSRRTGAGRKGSVVALAAGLTFELAWLEYPATRGRERRLKNQGSAYRRCPLCRGTGGPLDPTAAVAELSGPGGGIGTASTTGWSTGSPDDSQLGPAGPRRPVRAGLLRRHALDIARQLHLALEGVPGEGRRGAAVSVRDRTQCGRGFLPAPEGGAHGICPRHGFTHHGRGRDRSGAGGSGRVTSCADAR